MYACVPAYVCVRGSLFNLYRMYLQRDTYRALLLLDCLLSEAEQNVALVRAGKYLLKYHTTATKHIRRRVLCAPVELLCGTCGRILGRKN